MNHNMLCTCKGYILSYNSICVYEYKHRMHMIIIKIFIYIIILCSKSISSLHALSRFFNMPHNLYQRSYYERCLPTTKIVEFTYLHFKLKIKNNKNYKK